MRSLEVKFKTDANEEEAFRVTLERQAPSGWVGSADSVMFFAKDATQTLLLEEGTRVVIEPHGATVEMVYDKDQNAAMPRFAFETKPDQAAKEKIEADRQQEVRDIESGKIKRDRADERAAELARDKAIQEQLAKQNEGNKTPHPGSDDSSEKPAASTGTSQGSPQSPAAANQAKPGQGGMTAPGPSTGGQSSKDVK